jgi:hypothetical protein
MDQQVAYAKAHLFGSQLLWADVEVDDGLSLAQVGIVAEEFLAAFPSDAWPIAGIYCDLNYYAQMAGVPWGHPCWIAEPGKPNPTVPAFLQQYGTFAINGVAFDANRWYGTDEQFDVLFGLSNPQPVPPSPEEDTVISSFQNGTQQHVFVYENSKVVHWWNDVSIPPGQPGHGWQVESLPAAP